MHFTFYSNFSYSIL